MGYFENSYDTAALRLGENTVFKMASGGHFENLIFLTFDTKSIERGVIAQYWLGKKKSLV
jgi:hypothetical protein